MKQCILCKKETEGSTGAAGIRWLRICQTCKDIEDKNLAKQIACAAYSLCLVNVYKPTRVKQTQSQQIENDLKASVELIRKGGGCEKVDLAGGNNVG